MNPALLAYMQQVQKQQQAPTNYPSIEQGIGDAMKYGNMLATSTAPTPQQQNANFWNALGAINQTLNTPHMGLPRSRWARLNAGMQAYNQAHQQGAERSRQQNMGLFQAGHHLHTHGLRDRRDQEREHKNDLLRMGMLERDEERHRERMGLERAKLGRMSLSDIKAGHELSKMQEIDKLQQQGYIPLGSLEPSARSDFQKDVRKKVSEIKTNKRSLEILDKMEKIFEKYPDIGTDFTHILSNPGNSWFSVTGRRAASKPRLAAIQQLKKYAADLNLATIQGMPAKMGTDLLKRTIADAAPNGDLTAEAFFEIAKTNKARAEQNIREAHEYQQALRMGVMPMAAEIDHYESEPPEEAHNQYDNYSEDELRAMIAQAEGRER